jgi:hypothetical protein
MTTLVLLHTGIGVRGVQGNCAYSYWLLKAGIRASWGFVKLPYSVRSARISDFFCNNQYMFTRTVLMKFFACQHQNTITCK